MCVIDIPGGIYNTIGERIAIEGCIGRYGEAEDAVELYLGWSDRPLPQNHGLIHSCSVALSLATIARSGSNMCTHRTTEVLLCDVEWCDERGSTSSVTQELDYTGGSGGSGGGVRCLGMC